MSGQSIEAIDPCPLDIATCDTIGKVDSSPNDTKQSTMRVGDAERDACVAALIDHHLHGRLSVDELDRRQRTALDAITAGDLRLLLADLPGNELPDAKPLRREITSEVSIPLTRTAMRVLPVGLILAGASLFQYAWEFSAEGVFLGGVSGGALGYATHAALVRMRR